MNICIREYLHFTAYPNLISGVPNPLAEAGIPVPVSRYPDIPVSRYPGIPSSASGSGTPSGLGQRVGDP